MPVLVKPAVSRSWRDEVRSLAQHQRPSGAGHFEKIEAAVTRSTLGGAASQKVVESLAEVENTAGTIHQAFDGIVAQIKSLDEVVTQIASASGEQSQGVSELNSAVGQMDKVTQSNAASAEENASAAEELSNQVGTLQNSVAQLKSIVFGGGHSEIAAVDQTAISPDVGRQSKPIRAKFKSPVTPPAPGFRKVPANRDIPMPEAVGSAQGGFQDF
ncbi:MAG: methyl-accepting chemotaxis protein [Verrucomicrobiota bacterium]